MESLIRVVYVCNVCNKMYYNVDEVSDCVHSHDTKYFELEYEKIISEMFYKERYGRESLRYELKSIFYNHRSLRLKDLLEKILLKKGIDEKFIEKVKILMYKCEYERKRYKEMAERFYG